ncbi:MAG: right-handed parallel beta-helix repeat-containing protein [Hyphomicrobiales bacterium]|nr:right-handed parallel beta-helix repeat-containing protein [Hyphomicrobiales bacterium]
MDRRRFVAYVATLPVLQLTARSIAATSSPAHPNGDQPKLVALKASGPVTSQSDGEVIENLDIEASGEHGVTVRHQNVAVRNCRIRHAQGHGVRGEGAARLSLRDLEIINVGAPPSGPTRDGSFNNVDLDSCPGTVMARLRAERGAANIYGLRSEALHMSELELHDARGPEPRGQNVQLDKSPNSILESFSGENGSTSWTEDNISLFESDNCSVRNGLVSYNNSPTGCGIMIEGSFNCTVTDVDALMQGDGAFAAVPSDHAGCGGCTFLRCRTANSYNAPRDGRPAPASNGLSIYTRISNGAQRHSVVDCHYHALANPHNLVWEERALNPGWSFTPRNYVPRAPVRLTFAW